MIRAAAATDMGNTADAVLDEWGASVARVAARYPVATAVIPGHGEVGDNALLAHTIALAAAPLRTSLALRFAPLAFAAGDFGRESFEMAGPEVAEAGEPLVDLAQGLGLDGVDAARAVDARRGEAIVAQHFQMLRNGSLGDAVLVLDHLDDRAGGQFAIGEELENAPPHRVAEDVESVHQPSFGASVPV
jgi:hypothetical protein